MGELDKKGAFVMEMYPEAKGKFYNPILRGMLGVGIGNRGATNAYIGMLP